MISRNRLPNLKISYAKKIFLKDLLVCLAILLISYFYVLFFCQGIIPRAIDWGLVLSGAIQYDHPSVMQAFLYSSTSIVFDAAASLIRIGLSIRNTSDVILVLPIVMNIYGSYLIVFQQTKNTVASCMAAIIFVFSQIAFIWVDYPTLFLSDHTGGVYSFSIVTLTIGFLIANKCKALGVQSILNFAIHPVVGGLIAGVIIFWIIINKAASRDISLNINNVLKGVYFGLLLVVPYFLIKGYYSEINFDPNFNIQDYLDWVRYWDTHRDSSYGSRGFQYIVIQIFIVTALLIMNKFNPQKSENTNFFIYLLILCLTIYLLKPLYPDFLRRFMVNRIAIFPQFVVALYIFGSLLRSGNKVYFRNIALISFIFIFLLSGFIFNNKILELPDASLPKHSLKGILLRAYVVTQPYIGGYRRAEIWRPILNLDYTKNDISEIRKRYGNGLMVTTSSINRDALIDQRLPLVIDSGGYDFVSYYPKYATDVKNIITDIYGLSFTGGKLNKQLDEILIRPIFQARGASDWGALSRIYGIKYIAVPADWNLDLKLIFNNNIYKIFIIM